MNEPTEDQYQIKCDKDAKEYFKALYKKEKTKKVKKTFETWRKNNPKYYKACEVEKRKVIKKHKKRREYQKEYLRKKRKNDFVYRLRKSVSENIRQSLKGNKSSRCWEVLVGYTLNDLKKHLESLFQKDMSWENYGKWHIDHIIPISSFNIISAECQAFKKCWALNNLQPLWQFDNLRKSNKFLY